MTRGSASSLDAPTVIYYPTLPVYDFIVKGLDEIECDKFKKELPEKWRSFYFKKFNKVCKYTIEVSKYHSYNDIPCLFIDVFGYFTQFKNKILKDCTKKYGKHRSYGISLSVYFIVEEILAEFLCEELKDTKQWTMYRNHFTRYDV